MDTINLIARRDGWDCAYCTQPLLWMANYYGSHMVLAPDGTRVNQSRSPWIYGERVRICSYQFWSGAIVPTIDHVVPRSQGGNNSIENLVLSCRLCNSRKGMRTADQFLEHMYTWRNDHLYAFLALAAQWRETRAAITEMIEFDLLEFER